MNKVLGSIVAVICLAGCSAHTSPPPVSPIEKITEVNCDKATQDNFDKAGAAVGNTSRFAFEEAKKGYRYLTSEEMVEHYKEFLRSAKDAANKAVNKAEETYKEHTDQK